MDCWYARRSLWSGFALGRTAGTFLSATGVPGPRYWLEGNGRDSRTAYVGVAGFRAAVRSGTVVGMFRRPLFAALAATAGVIAVPATLWVQPASSIMAPTTTTTTAPPLMLIPAGPLTTTTSPVVARRTTTTTPPVTVPPSTATTTITRPGQLATPTTPTTTTATTTTAPSAIVQQPASTSTSTMPDAVGVVTIPPGEPGELAAGPTVPVDPGEPAEVGQWSTDPADWSPEVQQYLQSQGLDVDELTSQGAAAAGAPDQLLSNEGCTVNCITSGLMWAVGVGAYLEVTTSVPAFIQIEILDVGLKFGPPSASIWGATWAHLEPGTTYQVIARAHDAQGNMAVASGEFTTFRRAAEITFTPTVFWFGNLPDFNPFGDYLWQLGATAYLNGQPQAGATGAPAVNEDIVPTASDLALSFNTGTIDPSVIEVAYVGIYDCVAGCAEISFWDLFKATIFGPDPQRAVSPMEEHSNGVTPESFWGTVANGIQLDGYPNNVTSWTGHQFTFPLSTFFGDTVGPPVYLTVDVTVEVSYTP